MNWYEPSKFTEIGIAGSAVDVEKMGAIPTGIDHQPAATGTDDQFLSKHMAKQELKNRGILGRKANSAQTKKARNSLSENRAMLEGD